MSKEYASLYVLSVLPVLLKLERQAQAHINLGLPQLDRSILE